MTLNVIYYPHQIKQEQIMKSLSLLVLLGLLVSCGGGGGSSTAPDSGSTPPTGVTLSERVDKLQTDLAALQEAITDGVSPGEEAQAITLSEEVIVIAEETIGTEFEAEVEILSVDIAALVEEVAPVDPYDGLTAHTYTSLDLWRCGTDCTVTFYSNMAEVALMEQTPVDVTSRQWLYGEYIDDASCPVRTANSNFIPTEDGTSFTSISLTWVLFGFNKTTCLHTGDHRPDETFVLTASAELTPNELLSKLVARERNLKKIREGDIITVNEFGSDSIVYSRTTLFGITTSYKFQ